MNRLERLLLVKKPKKEKIEKVDKAEKNDKIQFAKVIDRQEATTFKSTFTDFLDPARCSSFLNILKREQKLERVFIYGGHEYAERKVIGFLAESEFEQAEEPTSLFPITPLSVMYNSKFSKPPIHRDYLGSILALGLDRGKIGDIVLAMAGATVYVHSSIANFIAEHLLHVGQAPVTVKIGQVMPKPTSTANKKRTTVASMRVDCVIGGTFNLSRKDASVLVEREKVFVNWKTAKKSYIVKQGDIITVRGIGRVEIGEQVGITKKERIILDIILFTT